MAGASMEHPSVDDILAGSGAAQAHVEICAACRALASIAAPVRTAASGSLVGGGLPRVDRALYADFQELDDRRGGMGRIFRARDTRLGRVVLIKQLHEDDGDASFRADLRRRFEREARLAACLEHPAIACVHEAGTWDDGEPFYAMRFVIGAPLEEEIAKRASLRERVALLTNLTVVADALAYAHERRIVHRDVKPRNVVLGRFGETVLVDWGLAKHLDAEERDAERDGRDAAAGLTQLGVGTAQYMPPEQARGAPADARMDVYALGATMYHALAGVPPYGRGDTTEVRRRLLEGPPRPLAELVPEVPAELVAIVAKAMHREPERRFAGAREMAEELHRFQSGQLLLSHRYTPRELLGHWVRRNRTPLRIALAAGVVLVASGAASVSRVVRERNRAEANERAAQAALQRTQGVTASHLAADGATRLDALATAVQAVAPSLAAGEEPPPDAVQGLFDAVAAGPAEATLGEKRARASSFTLSPKGDRLALSDETTTIVWDVASGREIARRKTAVPAYVQRFSPDGARLVACGYHEDAEAWSLADGAAIRMRAVGAIGGCDFLPDGRVVTAADAVVVWSREGKEEAHLDLPKPAGALETSVDGRVAVATLDGAVTVWDPRSGATSRAIDHLTPANAIAFAPDGSFLVSAGGDGRVIAYDPDPGGKITRLVEDPDAYFSRPLLVSPNGRFVAALKNQNFGVAAVVMVDRWKKTVAPASAGFVSAFDRDGATAVYTTPTELVIARAEGGGALLRVPALARGWGLMTADRVISHDMATSRLFVLDVAPGAASGVMLGHTSEITSARASPDGSRFATASLDGTVRTWDARTGAPLSSFDARAAVRGARWVSRSAIVAADVEGVAHLIDADAGREVRAFAGGAPLLFAASAEDGSRLATCATDGTVIVFDAATGHELARVKQEVTPFVATFSTDTSRLDVGYSDGVVRAYDAASGAEVARSEDLDEEWRDGISSLTATRDGAHVIAGTARGQTALLDARTLARVRTFEGRPASPWTSPLSPDERALALVTPDDRVIVTPLDGGPTRSLTGGSGLALQATFSADGARVASSDAAGVVRTWDAASGALLRTLAARSLGEATALALAPDDRYALVGYGSGGLRLLPLALDAAIDRACGVQREG
jgi:WD40 repeat protein